MRTLPPEGGTTNASFHLIRASKARPEELLRFEGKQKLFSNSTSPTFATRDFSRAGTAVIEFRSLRPRSLAAVLHVRLRSTLKVHLRRPDAPPTNTCPAQCS